MAPCSMYIEWWLVSNWLTDRLREFEQPVLGKWHQHL